MDACNVPSIRRRDDTVMAKRSGMYGRDKRQKELKRKKKQEEKRRRRQGNSETPFQEPERSDTLSNQAESSENAHDGTDRNEERTNADPEK